MGVNDNIVFSKGSYSVTLHTIDGTSESVVNTLKVIDSSGGTTEGGQSSGAKNTIIVDLLRLKETYHVEGYISASATKTAKQIKDDLREITNGAGINGGEITMTYEDSSITGYIESLVIKKISNDDVVGSGYTNKDSAEYQITVDFVKGVSYSNR